MIDFNDPNFLLADSDPLKQKAEVERRKRNVRDVLGVALVLATIWGIAIIFVISRFSD